jgi:peptide/nickel transport system substrate-binding protein
MKSLKMVVPTWRSAVSVLLAIVSAIAFVACSPADVIDQFNTQSAQVSQFVATVGTDPKTFNYALSQESPNVFDYMYEGLIGVDGITNQLQPAQAESWEISDDKKRIVFTLREGLKWSDGQPLTADDVVFTFNDIYLNEAIPAPTRDVLKIGKSQALPKVRKLDERRVEFTVPEPFAPFLLNAGGAAILPAHALREAVTTKDSQGQPKFLSTWGTDTNPTKIIGNGPYQMESYSINQRVVFRRNPHYWRKDAQGNSMPYIDRFIWQIIENTDTALLQFRSQESDLLGISPATFALLKHEEKRGQFTIYNGGPDTARLFMCFNLNQARKPNGQPLINPSKSRWFNTVEFRQAIAHAIDRPSMINNIFRGLGEPQNSMIPEGSPYYLSPQDGLKIYNYDLDRAKELLLGAGFKYSDRGELFDAEGNRVRFTLLTNAGGRTISAIGAQIKQNLSNIGIQVDFQAIDFNALLDKLNNTLDWESYLGAIGGGGLDPHSSSTIWAIDGGLHTFNSQPPPGQPPLAGQQFADWEREMAQLYVQGAQELDDAKRKAIYAEGQRLAQEYLPFIHLVSPLSLAAIRDRIQGVKYSALGGSLWNIYELKVDDKKS